MIPASKARFRSRARVSSSSPIGVGRWARISSKQSVARLRRIVQEEWSFSVDRWSRQDVVLFDGVSELLCRAACRWAGIALLEPEAAARTRQLVAIIEGAFSVGPRYWRAIVARGRAEAWLAEMIESIRAHAGNTDTNTPVEVVAMYRDVDGAYLPPRVAAVELLNLLRPIVAISRYVVFAAHALHKNPEWLRGLVQDDEALSWAFAQEVRRYYPMVPFVTARVIRDFDWNGFQFPAQRRVVLDLYGTNHHELLWQNPDRFDPRRFLNHDISPFNFIPQGGGHHSHNHCCPGEWFVIEIVRESIRTLTQNMTYIVPKQDLAIPLSRIPTLPRSGFRVSAVQPRSELRVWGSVESTAANGPPSSKDCIS